MPITGCIFNHSDIEGFRTVGYPCWEGSWVPKSGGVTLNGIGDRIGIWAGVGGWVTPTAPSMTSSTLRLSISLSPYTSVSGTVSTSSPKSSSAWEVVIWLATAGRTGAPITACGRAQPAETAFTPVRRLYMLSRAKQKKKKKTDDLVWP